MQPPPELNAAVDALLAHYPPDKKRSAMLMALHAMQEHYGFISDPMIEWTAKKLECQPIHVAECVTFYPMFRRKRVGKYHIKICRTLSCELAGSHKLAQALKQKLGIGMDEVTRDRRFSLAWVECLAACDKGPCVTINDDHYENVTPAKLDEILAIVAPPPKTPVQKATLQKPDTRQHPARKRAAPAPAVQQKPSAEARVAVGQLPRELELPPIEAYNLGVSMWRVDDFEEAVLVFEACMAIERLKMPAAYARQRCLKEMGRDAVLPAELAGKADDTYALGDASNLVCLLLEDGHKAALEAYGTLANVWNVVAEIAGARYIIRITCAAGEFINWAWREVEGKLLSVPDPAENPSPTEADRFVISLIEHSSSLPLASIPADGVPQHEPDHEHKH
ncbi:MAG: NAD(P)H-dependent oxidoreductase subunit E [Verrucomicrobia bacterium]|nr:NAD(P)H-dependent oxidoreductase subunit E [Verrucomicrobiota bacterium]